MSLEADTDCHFGDHRSPKGGACSNCGDTNYRLLGWYGAVARWARNWGVTEGEASDRIVRRQIAADIKAGRIEGCVEDYV